MDMGLSSLVTTTIAVDPIIGKTRKMKVVEGTGVIKERMIARMVEAEVLVAEEVEDVADAVKTTMAVRTTETMTIAVLIMMDGLEVKLYH